MSQIIEGRIANLLGNFGLLPFFVLAAAAWVPFDTGTTLRIELLIDFALVGYAAVILSFLGAVHWGLVLANPQLDRVRAWNGLGWGVIPAILGWLAVLLLAAGAAKWLVLTFLIGDMVLAWLMDKNLVRIYSQVPSWYLPLRTRLTFGAVIALLIALFSG